MSDDYYDEYWSPEGFSPPPNRHEALHELFASAIREGDNVLDLGCGDGRTSSPLVLARGASYVGADVSRTAVATAVGAGLDVRLIEDPRRLPFAGASFDVVVCVEVLEHLFAPHEVAVEVHRVLRPGGTFVATVPNTAYWRRRMELLLLGRFHPMGDDQSRSQPWRDPHIRFFTPTSLREMLSSAGFESVTTSGFEGRLVRGESAAYRALERRFPSLLARRVSALATRY